MFLEHNATYTYNIDTRDVSIIYIIIYVEGGMLLNIY